MALDALYREECCGSHFREDLEPSRDDEKFSHVAAWQWTGESSQPKLHIEDLSFEEIEPSKREY